MPLTESNETNINLLEVDLNHNKFIKKFHQRDF